MGDHADLSAMVGFVGEHVAKHFEAWGPGFAQGVSAELLEVAAEHVRAEGGAMG